MANAERPPGTSRQAIVPIAACIDSTPFTWLQYHTATVVAQRNRLALLPVPQLMCYANLHFHQITSFRQVEMKPLSLKDAAVALNKVVNIARRAAEQALTKKKGGQHYTLARVGLHGKIDDDDETRNENGDDANAGPDYEDTDDDSRSATNSESGSIVGLHPPPAMASLQKSGIAAAADNSLGPSDSTTSLASSASAAGLLTAISEAGADATFAPEATTEPKNSSAKPAAETALQPDLLPVERDDFDDAASLQALTCTPGAHILDASLNRLRQLDKLQDISQWTVSCIMFLNLSGNLLVSLEGIACCRNLRVLDCSDNILTHMTPLRGCRLLKRLRINGNRLVTVSLTENFGGASGGEASGGVIGPGTGPTAGPGAAAPLPGPGAYDSLFNLEYLDISDNKMHPTDGLRGLGTFGQRLVHLECRNCSLATSAFAELFGLANLETFHADFNLIDDLGAMVPVLRSIPHLKHLSLLGNPVAGGDAGPAAPEAEAKAGRAEPPRPKYAITVFDNISTLKTFDHLAVPPGLYFDLGRLKGQIIGEDMLREITARYSKEIIGIQRVHENLRQRHKIDEEMVESAVQKQSRRLEEELEDLLIFGKESIAKLQPRYAEEQHHLTVPGDDVLANITKRRAELSLYQKK